MPERGGPELGDPGRDLADGLLALDARLRQEQQREEQHDLRDGERRGRPTTGPAQEVLLEHEHEPDQQTAGERERKALQPADDGRRERGEDEQRERLHVEGRELLGEEDARDRGHRRADAPTRTSRPDPA